MNHIRPFGILYVDDEPMSLKYFCESFGDIANVFTASNTTEAFDLFMEKQEEIGIILSDQRMPGETGISFLSRIRDINPQPLRILVTAYADFHTAVDALNDGILYSYLSKPWDPEDLESRLINALDHFEVTHQRDKLLAEKSLAFQHLSMADKAASMSILSCGLNHHMRNALTAVHTFLELTPIKLEEELGGPPEDSEFWGDFYRQAHGQIGRMTSILTNLWEASNSRDLYITENIDLARIFQEAATIMIESGDNIDVKVLAAGEFPVISGDATKLSQMARLFFQEAKTNLVSGGNIEVHVAEDSQSDGIRISVIDDGEPIADEDLNRLFDPFYVRADKPNEFGMNLVACYLTVFYHGGTMNALHLRDGRNAIVFTLPRIAMQPAERTKISRELLNHTAVDEIVLSS